MGEAASALKALSCDSMAKYWLNAMHCSSECCGGWCSCEYTTDMVEISDSDSDFELELSDCCSVRKGKLDASGETT